MSKKLTIELPDELADFAQAKVAAGEYATLNDAIAAGMQNLQDHDAMIERWLQEEVAPTYDRWRAGLEETYTEDEVFDDLYKLIDEIAAQKDEAGDKAAE